MRPCAIVRRIVIAMAALAVLAAAAGLALAAAADAGWFRGTLIRLIAARAQRPIEVAGLLRVHLLARHPDLTAEGVTVGNPPWVPAGRLAEVGQIRLVFDVPWFERSFGIVSLSLGSATLHLERDSAGRANWQWHNPNASVTGRQLPILRTLSMPEARVTLEDARRHLKFEGTVSVDGTGTAPLRIEGRGELNGRADSFQIIGESLARASHEAAFRFSFEEHSSGSRLTGHGLLPKPFDFGLIDATFQAAGEDLRDLYYLTGVTLINTGRYELSGSLARRGPSMRFDELKATSGQSDVRGSVSIDSSGRKPNLAIDLQSTLLRLEDLGARAAARGAPGKSRALLLSTAALKPATLRHGNAQIDYRAARLEVARVPLTDLSGRGRIQDGVLSVTPLTAGILGGRLSSNLTIDARSEVPSAKADIAIAGLQLSRIDPKSSGSPPAGGTLDVRVAVTGTGESVHEVAADADGTVSAFVPAGSVRESLAEITGIDLRGLGLILTKDKRQVPLRCAAAVFKDHDGTLTAERLVADTDSVLIEGGGRIDLGTETLDLSISGHPKSPRLFKFRSPVLIQGTLEHPVVHVETRHLTIVDLGRARDADCAALKSQADTP